MAFRIALPGSDRRLDIVDGTSTAVQRALRDGGIASYEPTTVAALATVLDAQQPGFTFYDVGANVGIYSALCASLFEPGAVLAFEPTPRTAEIARTIVQRNDLAVEVVQAAVGERAGRADLYLSATSDASNSLVHGFKQDVGAVSVDVVSIDELVAAGHPAPDVIKMDVETFEPDVLRGARRTIEAHRPVLIVEVLHRRGHDHGPSIEHELRGLGYHYYRLGTAPGWKRRPHITGKRRTSDRDYLLLPGPLPPGFVEQYDWWREAVATCTPDRNDRLPVRVTIASLAAQHGWRTPWFLARAAGRRVRWMVNRSR